MLEFTKQWSRMADKSLKPELRYSLKPDVHRLKHGKKDVSYSNNVLPGEKKALGSLAARQPWSMM